MSAAPTKPDQFKFVLVTKEIISTKGRCQWLDNDSRWNEFLLLKVHGDKLRKLFDDVPVGDLVEPYASQFSQKLTCLSHKLLLALTRSLSLLSTVHFIAASGASSTTEPDSAVSFDLETRMRQTHALEILGVVLGSIIERPFVDFNQHVMRALCAIDTATQFFSGLFTSLLQYVNPLGENNHRTISSNDHFHDDDGGGDDSGYESDYIQEEVIQLNKDATVAQGTALSILVLVGASCENLQQNTMLDFLMDHSKELWDALIYTYSGNTDFANHEIGLQLLVLLVNFRKYEFRNPVSQSLAKCSINDLHTITYAMEAMFTRCLADLHGSANPDASQVSNALDQLTDWAEESTASLMSYGVNFASGIGAWMAGMKPSAETKPTKTDDARRVARDERSHHAHHGSSLYGTSGQACVTVESSRVVPRLPSGRKCNLNRWVRVRFGLLSFYEVFCNNNPKFAMKELVSHNVMPWVGHGNDDPPSRPSAHRRNSFMDSIPQPVACPYIVNQALTLVTFCLHSGNAPVVKLALIVLQCMLEHFECSIMIFASSLEDASGVQSLKVYERPVSNGDTTLQYVNAVDTSVARNGNEARANGNAKVRAALAAVVFRQASLVLRTAVYNFKSKRDRLLDVELGCKALDVLHRLLCYQSRCKLANIPLSTGTNWSFVLFSMFDFLEALNTSESFVVNGKLCVEASTRLVRVLNLCIHVLDGKARYMLFYELVRNRAVLESWRRSLESHSAVSHGGARIVQHEMANIRSIVFHFSNVIATGMNANNANGETSPMTVDTVEKDIESSEGLLQLKPHDRQNDVYQSYVENPKESHILRSVLRSLLLDRKKVQPFKKRMKSFR